jgi:hypothetical protein
MSHGEFRKRRACIFYSGKNLAGVTMMFNGRL